MKAHAILYLLDISEHNKKKNRELEKVKKNKY